MWGIGWSFISFARGARLRAIELRGVSARSTASVDARLPVIGLRDVAIILASESARYATRRLRVAARMNIAVATSVIAGPEGRLR